MAVVVGSAHALSVAANTKSADQVTGQYEFLGKGKITLACLGSAVGLNAELRVGGLTFVGDEAVPFTGTAGTLDLSAHVICSQMINGGRVELFFRNTTAGALTMNYVLLFEPM